MLKDLPLSKIVLRFFYSWYKKLDTTPSSLNEFRAWTIASQFHGHECPGLAIGYRFALEALRLFELDSSFLTNPSRFWQKKDWTEELVCVSETDACCIDAIQIILGCTMGKGSLILKPRGKMAMTFYFRPTKTAYRLLLRPETINKNDSPLSKNKKLDLILNEPADNLIKISAVTFDPPVKAAVSRSLVCASCGELTAEFAVRLSNEKPYCEDCWVNPSRIL